MGVKTVFRPVWSARNRGWPFALEASKESDTFWPAVYFPLIVNLGKGVNGSCGFDDGQDVMKPEARVMIWFPVRGTSYAPDHGAMDCVMAVIQAA